MNNYEIEGTKLVSYDGDEAEFIIPDEVEELGEFVFSDSSFKKITISAKVNNVKASMFNERWNGTELEEIAVVDDNPHYTLKDGILYNKEMTKLIVCPTASKLSRVEIPESVTVIGENAFLGCEHLEEVILPKGCLSIEDDAFCGCWNLQKINLDNVKTIGSRAFSSCGLRKVELFSIESIEGKPFDNASLKEVIICEDIGAKMSEALFRKKVIAAMEESFDVFVLSKEDHSLIGVFPIHNDGNYHTDDLLEHAWKGNSIFDYQLLDDYFKSIRKPLVKTKIALTRLMYPFELNDNSKKQYQAHIKRNAVKIVEAFIDGPVGNYYDYSPSIHEKSFELCDSLGLLKKSNIDELINYASRSDNMQWSAFLLDWKNKNVEHKKNSIDFTAPDLLVGDQIMLGQYLRNGEDIPIEWIVVDSTKKQYLILSKYLIKEMPYFSGALEKHEFIGWAHSDVRKWLNDEFYMSAFDENERARICLKKHKNKSDVDTEDYVFIPNETEFNKYVGGVHFAGSDFKQKNLGFSYGNQNSQGEEEMLRTTRMYYSNCCVETRILFKDLTRDLNNSYFIRPMMWISK